jgi:hypothetical protein
VTDRSRAAVTDFASAAVESAALPPDLKIVLRRLFKEILIADYLSSPMQCVADRSDRNCQERHYMKSNPLRSLTEADRDTLDRT